MIPSEYLGYFSAAAAAGAALIGLLFVAVSLRPDSIFGDGAVPLARAVSGSAFTALVNSFMVSLIALIPGDSLGLTAAIVALVSLLNTARLHRLLGWKESPKVLLVLSLLAYLSQLGIGIALIEYPHHVALVQDVQYLLIASFAVALSRAWALLQGKHTAAPQSQAPIS